ncbi:M protein [Praja virus]|nr:M protein [Praja virus]
METIDQWCTGSTYGWSIAIAVTYAPVAMFSLKATRGRLGIFLHFLCFVIVALLFGWMSYNHFKSTSTVAISLGAISCLVWACINIRYLVIHLAQRCRMLKLGPRFFVAPANCVQTQHFTKSITPSHSGALVYRKPGSTSVASTLVDKIKHVIVGGRPAKNSGAVSVKHLA